MNQNIKIDPYGFKLGERNNLYRYDNAYIMTFANKNSFKSKGTKRYRADNWTEDYKMEKFDDVKYTYHYPETMINRCIENFTDEGEVVYDPFIGIGTTAIQLAKHFGAKVYATAGSDEKCQVVEKLGAIKCFNYKTKEFEKEINQLTNKEGVNVILDMVAGDYVEKNLKCLSEDGRLVIIAVQGGLKGKLNFGYLMRKRYTITGSTLRPQEDKIKASYVRSLIKHVWPFLENRQVVPIISQS